MASNEGLDMGSIWAAAADATTPTGRAVAVRKQAVVVFAELRNFTRMSEALPPYRVLQLLDDFYSLAGEIFAKHGGEVFDTHNDGVTAAFRDGGPAQDSRRAIEAAQELQLRFGALNERWRNEFGLHSAVALGLHLGETVFGPGSDGPVAFGDSVTVAERLAHRARAGEFVLSDSVMGALSISNLQLDAEPLPALELTRRPPIRIYGVLLDTRLDFT